MLYAYGDLSGTKLTRVHVAACLLGVESLWAKVDAQWKRALEWAKVDHFHATDFFNCQGAFKAWTKGSKRHREAERRFLAIAADSGLAPSVFGVETAGFDAAFQAVYNQKAKPRLRVKTTRLMAAQGCLVGIHDILKKNFVPPDERVSVFFEQEQGIGEVIDFFLAQKRQDAPWLRRIIAVAQVEKSVRSVQVADFLAYEAYQFLTHYCSDHKAPYPPRFARFMEKPPTRWRVATVENQRDMIPKLREHLVRQGRA